MHLHAIAFLRAVHVLAGALWVGAAFMNALFLVPAIRATGPAGGQVMRALVQVRRLPLFMNTVMTLTLLSGLALYWWTSGGLHAAWIVSATGIAFTAGALLAIVTATLGMLVTVPTVKKLGALGAEIAAGGGTPTPEQAAAMGVLQLRMLRAAQAGTAMVVAATILMAVARYL